AAWGCRWCRARPQRARSVACRRRARHRRSPPGAARGLRAPPRRRAPPWRARAAPPHRACAPRRARRRMSNCVVGSGGAWLPSSTIAEHRVEGCDHFSHDGDDDDLGFFVGIGEAIVEGFEGGTVSACAEGGHVEDITDRHPTTVDAAVSLELAAI